MWLCVCLCVSVCVLHCKGEAVRVNELRTRFLVCIWCCRCEGFVVAGRDWVKDCLRRGVEIDVTVTQLRGVYSISGASRISKWLTLNAFEHRIVTSYTVRSVQSATNRNFLFQGDIERWDACVDTAKLNGAKHKAGNHVEGLREDRRKIYVCIVAYLCSNPPEVSSPCLGGGAFATLWPGEQCRR
jgi:hypothetical protein